MKFFSIKKVSFVDDIKLLSGWWSNSLNPRLNNCVGHFNHRYFFLYMMFMVVGCAFLMLFGAEILADQFFNRYFIKLGMITQNSHSFFLFSVPLYFYFQFHLLLRWTYFSFLQQTCWNSFSLFNAKPLQFFFFLKKWT